MGKRTLQEGGSRRNHRMQSCADIKENDTNSRARMPGTMRTAQAGDARTTTHGRRDEEEEESSVRIRLGVGPLRQLKRGGGDNARREEEEEESSDHIRLGVGQFKPLQR